VIGFADFCQRFFGEPPSQKTPDTGPTSIRVAKLGNAYTGQPLPHEIGHLCGLPPPGGPPRISLIPPWGRQEIHDRVRGGMIIR
jgi:hypothetical protein